MEYTVLGDINLVSISCAWRPAKSFSQRQLRPAAFNELVAIFALSTKVLCANALPDVKNFYGLTC
jgi:hypothetical protein